VHLSVFLGPFSKGPADDAPLIDMCIEQAVTAADAGFAMVTFGEQHFNNYEPYCNPFVIAGLLSPQLGETWFGTTIVPLPLHAPVRLAEDSSIVDLLLRGRFIMGMSAGRTFAPDFENFGLDPKQRDEIFSSKLDILLAARAHQPGDPPLVVDTPWDHARLDGRLMPVSWRSGGPVLAVGTSTDATIERFAALGWPLFLGPSIPMQAAGKFKLHRDTMGAAGFGPDEVRRASVRSMVTRHVIVGETDDEAWAMAEAMAGRNFMMDRSHDDRSMREMAAVDLSVPGAFADPNIRNTAYVQSWIIAGDPESVAAQIGAYEGLGIPHLNVRFTVGMYNPTLMSRSFDLFVSSVLPLLKVERFAPLATEEISTVHLAARP
jgi:alkanesulfonate monooxygenase SsuD/methylene tetrahydromethanopterin reductase-like flavin-dependent oxidoreductase (luciferase family)